MKNKYNIVLFALMGLGCLSCTQEKNTSGGPRNDELERASIQSQRARVIDGWGQNVIKIIYLGLADSTSKLNEQVIKLKSQPSVENLQKAQELWRGSRRFWEQTESFLFGPVESLGIDPMIDTWPLNISDLRSILSSAAPVTVQVLRSIGTNLKGFHTLEYLLFGEGGRRRSVADRLASLTAREIEYMQATSQVLAEDCLRLSHAWTRQSDPDNVNSRPYLEILTRPGVNNNIYSSEESVVSEILNGMIHIADEVANGKIAGPLGASLEDASPAAEESPFSGNSVADFANNIRSLQMLYFGRLETDLEMDPVSEQQGLYALLAAKDRALADLIKTEISLSIEKIIEIESGGLSFGEAILDPLGREKVQRAQSQVGRLHEILNTQVRPLF